MQQTAVREVRAEDITREVARLCQEANYFLDEDVTGAFTKVLTLEESPVGRDVLEQIVENARIAANEQVPMCQDTGYAVVFVEVGQDAHIVGGDLTEAINKGVEIGYREGYLRKSIVGDPFERKNTGTNTPAFIHTTVVPGDRVKVTMAAKGGGSENTSQLKMLKPSDGVEGVKQFVLKAVAEAGPSACPPLVVGVGVGGNFEISALLAKKAALRPIGSRNANPFVAKLEEELLTEVNKLGVGPQGLGGSTTALGLNIETFATHIVALPVAVNIQCHASRHKAVTL